MLTKEENDLVTQTGPGTPGGQLLRSYWQPAALSEELPSGGPPIPLRLFGEDLVLFRDDQARPGLLDLHCSHRGTDLSYGRLEVGGLRCIYHGWLYDVSGKCLETPGEPAGSLLKDYVQHRAYPCQEVGGVIFTYMGSADPPLLPNYEVLAAPADHRFMTKFFHECNYLQGLEGSHDSVHVQFLHRSSRLAPREPPPDGYWGPTRVEENDFSVWDYYSDGAARPNYTLPCLALTGGGPQARGDGPQARGGGPQARGDGPQVRGDGYMLYWRVPIDDTHHWLFTLAFKRSGPIPDEARNGPSWKPMGPNYHFTRNQANRYLQDREEQRTSTFTGMGFVFSDQDAAANESQGPIQDRTKETLGAGDIGIAAWRRMLLRAIRTVQEGRDPPGLIRDPRVNAVDPIFLKRNAPPSDADLEAILSEIGGRWVKTLGRATVPV